jgi:plastocyanin
MRHRIGSRSAATIAAAMLGGSLLVACGSSSKSSSGSSSATTVDLQAKNTTYSPTSIQLKAGEKVTFVVNNGDQIEHNLTIKDLKVNQDVEGGKTANVTVSVNPGTYQFHCEYHPQLMNGTITVA